MRAIHLLAAACVLAPVGAVLAEHVEPPSNATVGFMHAIHATEDVDKTLAFYTDVFGISAEVHPFSNPAVPILTNSPGASLRVAMLSLPGRGFNFELTEFTNTPRTPAQPFIMDPGAPHLKILVRNLVPVMMALQKRGAPILSRGAAPVHVTTSLGSVEAVFCRDPDGYLVEAVEVGPPDQADQGNVVGAVMGLTVADLDASLAFWNGLLGFDLKPDPEASTDGKLFELMGLPGGAVLRTASGLVPGSDVRLELTEFGDVPRGKEFSLRVPDPGASGMALKVAHIGALLDRLKTAGVRVLSRDGKLVEWSDTVRNVFVKDPNGLNLELVGDAND